MSTNFFIDQCQLSDRTLRDMHEYEDNWFLFENMLLAINSYEKEPNVAYDFLSSKQDIIFKLISNYPIKDSKVSVNFILKAFSCLK